MATAATVIVQLYRTIETIQHRVIRDLTPNGFEVLPLIAARGGSVRLGVDELARLIIETKMISHRDHLIALHLAGIEAHLFKNGYVSSGQMVRILSGHYGVATEEVKLSTISDGFQFTVATVSSAEDLIAATPLKLPSDPEYSELYENLMVEWGNPKQIHAAKLMWDRLQTIHDILPENKIGRDWKRVRQGRVEPLPMYVRNEIHHPSDSLILGLESFHQDKRIGFAMMTAWLEGSEPT